LVSDTSLAIIGERAGGTTSSGKPVVEEGVEEAKKTRPLGVDRTEAGS
jgi:hypothetical protein